MDNPPDTGGLVCPRCAAPDPLLIIYGYPEPEQIRSALRGEIAIGGVVYEPDPPQCECRDDTCGYTFTP